MELKCFYLMGTFTKRQMTRRNWKVGKNSGKTYHYFPQERLVNRLAAALKMNPTAVREQIHRERLYLLRELYGENNISDADV